MLLALLCFSLTSATYSNPIQISLPTSLSTSLTEQLSSTSCSSNGPTDVYASTYVFSSVTNYLFSISSPDLAGSNILIESALDHVCTPIDLTEITQITPNVEYKLILYSSNEITTLINLTIEYAPQETVDDQLITIKDIPFIRAISFPSTITKTSNKCSSNKILTQQFLIHSESDSHLSIDTCGFSQALSVISVSDEDSCIIYSDAYVTSDLSCSSGLGTEVSFDAYSNKNYTLDIGFLEMGEDYEELVFRVTRVGDAEKIQPKWITWVCFAVVTGIIIAFIVVVMLVITIYEVMRKRNKRRSYDNL